MMALVIAREDGCKMEVAVENVILVQSTLVCDSAMGISYLALLHYCRLKMGRYPSMLHMSIFMDGTYFTLRIYTGFIHPTRPHNNAMHFGAGHCMHNSR